MPRLFRQDPLLAPFLFVAALALLAPTAAAAAGSDELELLPARTGSCPLPAQGIPLPEKVTGKVHITADQAELREHNNSTLSGNVRIEQNGVAMQAGTVRYNRDTGTLRARGDVRFGAQHLNVQAKSADINLQRYAGEFRNAHYQMDEGARGRAVSIVASDRQHLTLNQARYTTCDTRSGSPVWQIRADQIEIDKTTGRGTLTGGTLRIKDIPVMYLPWFSFPIDERRQSGLLLPRIGTSENNGFDLTVPYYINLAPNYDATLTPRYMSEHGLQMGAEVRSLWSFGRASVNGEYLDNDDASGDQRYQFGLQYDGDLWPNADVHVNYQRVSDANYFVDLGTNLASGAATYLPRSVSADWQPASWFSVEGLLSDYQTLDPTLASIDRPYARLPQIRVNLGTPNTQGFHFGMHSEAAYFEHDDSARPEGARYNIRPNVGYTFDNGSNFARAQVAGDYTVYRLDSRGSLSQNHYDRFLPSFTLDLGQRYNRSLDNGWIQTLEPRLYYLYIPYENQKDLPVFDSSEPDFRFGQLFVDNRYTGLDRIGDANQLTLAATSRFIDPTTGLERVSVSLGQIYRFDDPRVGIFDPVTGRVLSAPLADQHSDLVGQFGYRFDRHWSSSSSIQYNPGHSRVTRGSSRLRYQGDAGQLAALSYRYRRGLLNQADLALAWPVTAAWGVLGRYNYSLRDDSSFEALAGVQYRNCCWAVTVAARRYLQPLTQQHTNGVYLQFELTGLGRIGNDFARLINRNMLLNSYF